MPGTEHRSRKFRVFRLPDSPITVFSGYRINALKHAADSFSDRDRVLATAFRSPMVTPASAGTRIPGSKFLACYFVPQTGRFSRSFGFSLHSQPPFCSGSGCFYALARFGFRNRSNLSAFPAESTL